MWPASAGCTWAVFWLALPPNNSTWPGYHTWDCALEDYGLHLHGLYQTCPEPQAFDRLRRRLLPTTVFTENAPMDS
ncbi:MAG: hypothetical protein EKK34_21960 [Mycobacterium sp.]|nr:MAG: hypothetical protein EKK34_21960 [Mycobacterium sp.]